MARIRADRRARASVPGRNRRPKRRWLAANQPRFVMWDATFDLAWDAGAGAPPATPNPARIALRSLRLPFRC